MIDELYLDSLQLMSNGAGVNGYYVNKFRGLELPQPRTNRPPRSRRHGAYELTTYYEPRELSMDIWVIGVSGGAYSWSAFWTAFENLKDSMSLSELQRTLRLRREGNPFSDYETASIVMSDAVEPRWPNAATPVCVFEDVVMVANDPRLYSYTLHTASGTSFSAVNAGNFASPPSITFSGAGTLTNGSLSTENVMTVTGACTVDCRARTVSDPSLWDSADSFFWSLKKGSNSITSTVSVSFNWYDARV